MSTAMLEWSVDEVENVEAAPPSVSPSAFAVFSAGVLFVTAAVLSFKAGSTSWSETVRDCEHGFYGGYLEMDGARVAATAMKNCAAPPVLTELRATQGAIFWDAPTNGKCDWYKVSKRRGPSVAYPGGVWQDGPAACEYSEFTRFPGSGPCAVLPGYSQPALLVQRSWLGAPPVEGEETELAEGTEVTVTWKDGQTINAIVEYKVKKGDYWRLDAPCDECYRVNFHDDDSFDFVDAKDITLRASLERRSEAAGGPVDFGRGDEEQIMEVRVSCGRAPPSAAGTWGTVDCTERSLSSLEGKQFCLSAWESSAAWGPWSETLRFAVANCPGSVNCDVAHMGTVDYEAFEALSRRSHGKADL